MKNKDYRPKRAKKPFIIRLCIKLGITVVTVIGAAWLLLNFYFDNIHIWSPNLIIESMTTEPFVTVRPDSSFDEPRYGESHESTLETFTAKEPGGNSMEQFVQNETPIVLSHYANDSETTRRMQINGNSDEYDVVLSDHYLRFYFRIENKDENAMSIESIRVNVTDFQTINTVESAFANVVGGFGSRPFYSYCEISGKLGNYDCRPINVDILFKNRNTNKIDDGLMNDAFLSDTQFGVPGNDQETFIVYTKVLETGQYDVEVEIETYIVGGKKTILTSKTYSFISMDNEQFQLELALKG